MKPKERRFPELNPPDFSHNHHGEYLRHGSPGITGAIYNDIFVEKDSLGRVTSCYHRKVNEWQWDMKENKPDRYSDTHSWDCKGNHYVKPGITGDRVFVIEYEGDSKRPKYVWNRLGPIYESDYYEFYGFEYQPNGDLKSIDYWANGGNTSGHYEYTLSDMKVKTYIDGKKVRETSKKVVKINKHETWMSKLPDPAHWGVYISCASNPHMESEALDYFGLMGHTSEYLPKRRMTKKEREWAIRNSPVAKMLLEMQESPINKGCLE